MDLGIRGKKAIINGGSAGMGKGSAMLLQEKVLTWLYRLVEKIDLKIHVKK